MAILNDSAPRTFSTEAGGAGSRACVNALGYIGVAADDLARWGSFATDVVGAEVSRRDQDGTLHLRIDDQFHRIIVHPGPSNDLAYTGWEVTGPEDLDAFAARLRSFEIPFERASAAECKARCVGGFLRLHDPSGIATEIYWGPLVDSRTPFKSPRAIGGFDTQGKGLGHVVLLVDDFERTMTFYRDVLGMRISDFIDFNRRGTMVTAAFLHCNPRHHSLAFIEVKGAPKRISHVMLEVLSLDDVGRTYSLCEESDVPVTVTLGKHTNDHMFSFYMMTPSGFALEYGWGGRTIDDETWQVQTHLAASIWGHRHLAPPAVQER